MSAHLRGYTTGKETETYEVGRKCPQGDPLCARGTA